MSATVAGAAAFAKIVAAFENDRRVELPARERRAFGSNGLKVDGRIFAMLVKGALVVKLPRARVEALIHSGNGEAFDAGRGRAMKEWVMLATSEEAWLERAREAYAFVGGCLADNKASSPSRPSRRKFLESRSSRRKRY